jgi:DNA-binding protein H-NS
MARTTVASQLAAIKRQQEVLAKKEAALLARSNDKVLKKIVQLAKDAGVTAKEIVAAMDGGKAAKPAAKASTPRKSSKLAGKKVAPKYLNPANAAETWTGRGIAPKWAADLAAQGQLNSALIA